MLTDRHGSTSSILAIRRLRLNLYFNKLVKSNKKIYLGGKKVFAQNEITRSVFNIKFFLRHFLVSHQILYKIVNFLVI